MPNRRTGILTSLLLAAALMLLLPGLMKPPMRDHNRMAPILRPPKLRTLTVWLTANGPEDGRLIRNLCSGFEKAHPGARIFLRRADAQEWMEPDAVRPDVLLFAPGEVLSPADVLLPLEGFDTQESSGQSALVRYAVPLWYAPAHLHYPEAWGDDPWQQLRTPGTLALPEGLRLAQLLMSCPMQHRSALIQAAQTQGTDARVMAEPAQEEGRRSIRLIPEVSDLVRFAAICRDGKDARAFVEYLLQSEAEPFRPAGEAAMLPNAFSHTAEERESLCADHFRRGLDPAQTLLQFR